jgi:hypothetical protein
MINDKIYSHATSTIIGTIGIATIKTKTFIIMQLPPQERFDSTRQENQNKKLSTARIV